MRLGLLAGPIGATAKVDMDLVLEAESLGFDSVWNSEAWGSDAITSISWMAAKTTKLKIGSSIVQMLARTPAMTAMSAMTLDALSGGRLILGLGLSGPQVIEGWHGKPFPKKPLTYTREYITILRAIFAREEKLQFDGEYFQIPYKGDDALGLGKPLKCILRGRPDIPIYTGSITPRSIAQCGEICDGLSLIFTNPDKFDVVQKSLDRGFARSPGKQTSQFDIAATVMVSVGDDLDALRKPMKAQLSLYIGGMGAKDKNFYKDYISSLGFVTECEKIQDAYLAGRPKEALSLVPDQLVDAFYLVGPKERITERFATWKDSPVTSMLLNTHQPEAIRLMAELADS